MTEVHSCGSPPFSTCLGAVASFIISQGQKCHKKLMHVESVINSDPKLIDAYKTAEKRLAEQKPTRSLSRGMEPPTR